MTQGSIYFIGGADAFSPVKVGWASKSPAERLGTLQVGSWVSLDLLGVVRGPRELEKVCHRRLKTHRVRGEWFQRQAALTLLSELRDFGPLLNANDLKRFESQQREAALGRLLANHEPDEELPDAAV